MARILPRRRPGFRVPRLRRSRRWTGQQTDDIVTSGTLATAPLVTPSDYQQSATLEAAGVTLVRIRGSIAVTPVVGPSNNQVTVVDLMVYVAEADSPNINPSVVQSLWQEEVLWYKRMILSDTRFVVQSTDDLAVDIRAKRKLDNHEVRFAIVGNAVSGAAFSYALATGWRILLIGG